MIQNKSIHIDDLICMHDYADQYHFRIDLAYSSDNNLLFGERIYNTDTKLWLYKDLANVVFKAAHYCFETYRRRFVLLDGLRTVNAQEKMMETQRAKDNPHWMEPPRLLSPPGSGGHPRGMAIDIALETLDGKIVDMGTPFDHMADNPYPEHNQAHREYNHPEHIKKNRSMLDNSMITAAQSLQTAIILLPEEWWDFRLPADIYNQFSPLSDNDLPDYMHQVI